LIFYLNYFILSVLNRKIFQLVLDKYSSGEKKLTFLVNLRSDVIEDVQFVDSISALRKQEMLNVFAYFFKLENIEGGRDYRDFTFIYLYDCPEKLLSFVHQV